MSTWEQRMAKRARRMAIKRQLRVNLEGEARNEPQPLTNVVFCQGFECGTGPLPDEWSEYVDEGINPLRTDGTNWLKDSTR